MRFPSAGPLLFAVLLAGCAGTAEKDAAYDGPRGESAEMEDLEPAGPFDATLEDESDE